MDGGFGIKLRCEVELDHFDVGKGAQQIATTVAIIRILTVMLPWRVGVRVWDTLLIEQSNAVKIVGLLGRAHLLA